MSATNDVAINRRRFENASRNASENWRGATPVTVKINGSDDERSQRSTKKSAGERRLVRQAIDGDLSRKPETLGDYLIK